MNEILPKTKSFQAFDSLVVGYGITMAFKNYLPAPLKTLQL